MRGADYGLFVLKLEGEHYFVGTAPRQACELNVISQLKGQIGHHCTTTSKY